MLSFRRKPSPLPAPVAPPAAAPVPAAKPESPSSATSIRETIDLLELDLSAMIREVERAAAAVRGGASASAEALTAIRSSTEIIAAKSRDANRNADQVAGATYELAQSSSQIDQQVRVASSLTDDAGDAATAANQSVDGLKSSSAEIGKVVNLIANIAQQTNLLALNATIEGKQIGLLGNIGDEIHDLANFTRRCLESVHALV